MTQPPVAAALVWQALGQTPVGRDRIAMLEAVGRHGSISAAAKALGYSYKSVWDGVAAINNLLTAPAVVAHKGGRAGGSSSVTPEGERLIAAFHRLEARLTDIAAALLQPDHEDRWALTILGLGMKTSARNVLRCTVTAIQRAPVNVEVQLTLGDGATIFAVVTNYSADLLALAPGREVLALVKAPNVAIALGNASAGLSTQNQIPGQVLARIDGGVNSEITVDIGAGKTLVAVITRASADRLHIAPGVPVHALFEASQVILACD